jgi:hypothetical protein
MLQTIQSACFYVNAVANRFVSLEIVASVGCHEAAEGTAGSVTVATAPSVIKPKQWLHQVPGQLCVSKTTQPGREEAYT